MYGTIAINRHFGCLMHVSNIHIHHNQCGQRKNPLPLILIFKSRIKQRGKKVKCKVCHHKPITRPRKSKNRLQRNIHQGSVKKHKRQDRQDKHPESTLGIEIEKTTPRLFYTKVTAYHYKTVYCRYTHAHQEYSHVVSPPKISGVKFEIAVLQYVIGYYAQHTKYAEQFKIRLSYFWIHAHSIKRICILYFGQSPSCHLAASFRPKLTHRTTPYSFVST